MLTSCVTPAYMCGLEKMEKKVQVCENNWMRRIVRVKRADEIRMDELRLEVGVKETLRRHW